MFINVKSTIVYLIFIYLSIAMCSKDGWTATSTNEPAKKED